MAFQTALSGLNAASGSLDVTGNNIANSSTTGFKKSRAEFADVYAVSFGGVSDTATGSGVRLAKVSQQFTQGNVDFTDNNLDLAISGEGFFALNDNGGDLYSRAGNFRVDREGYVVNAHGHKLQKYDVDDDGAVTNFTPEDMRLNLGANPASATDEVELNVNLDADSELDTVQPLDTSDPDSYNFSTTTTVYDSLGVTHDASMYFQKAPATSRVELSGELEGTGGAETVAGFTNVYDSLGNSYSADVTFQQTAAGPPAVYDVTLAAGADSVTVSGVQPDNDNEITFSNFDPSGGTASPADLTVDLSGVSETGNPISLTVNDQSNTGPEGEWNTVLEVDGQTF
ncbi:MAG TPA: flagellar hook-basal body complex protein, partial [Gammaproteobacteria bacterium]|nr:flagellar hook-basal body complex protein [Gammaproteobacteria bacterium]